MKNILLRSDRYVERKTVLLLFFPMIFFGLFCFNIWHVVAANLYVPSQFLSIQSAIKSAQDGDTIIVAPGTYYENITLRKGVEIRSSAGRNATIIDGGFKDSVIFIAKKKQVNGSVPKVIGFTIRNGKSSEGRGGGITVYDADPVIENNIIISNRSSMDGGGILLNENSLATIRNNIIDSNQSFRFGGAIHIVDRSHALIYNNHILKNKTTGANYGSWGSSGGAIFVDSNSSPQILKNNIEKNSADFAGGAIALRKGVEATVNENVISENDAAYGGAIHIETEGSAVTIIGNTIKKNTAWQKSVFHGSGYGGGIAIYNASRVKVRDNGIHDNTGQSGGGGIVLAENANATIDSNNIYRNNSNDYQNFTGGGIYVADATAYIHNNNLYENEARIGGAIGLDAGAKSYVRNNTIIGNIKTSNYNPQVAGGINVRPTVTTSYIQNNIIADNTGYQIFEDITSGQKSIIQNNLINDDGDGIYYNYASGAIHDIASINTNNNIAADSNISGSPSFVNESANDYHLNSNSDALDKGRNVAVSFDHDGNFRPVNSIYDIGAYERTSVENDRATVYRFWSDINQRHFYTISKGERDTVLNTYPVILWRYEGEAYQAMPLSNCNGDKVHRFWSDAYQGHFYTLSESEKNAVIQNYPDNIWRYEGEAFCAKKNKEYKTTELYRFWSEKNNGHFYTASSSEKNSVIQNYPDYIWRYEGVNFYAYPTR